MVRGFSQDGIKRIITRIDVATQNATMLVAALLAGLVVHASVTGAGTLTLDTAANLDAAFPNWLVGEKLACHYVNSGTQTVTLTGAAGVTALAVQTIPTLTAKTVYLLKTAPSTYIAWCD